MKPKFPIFTPYDMDAQATTFPRGPFVTTSFGRRFFLLDPKPEEVYLFDIAHALSQICRWTGATKRFLSVAEHSLFVSYLCPSLPALLHDAPEAYVGDNSRPMKAAVPQLREVEGKIWSAVATKFGIPKELSKEVHKADQVALASEIAQGFLPKPVDFEWERLPKPSELRLFGLTPIQAENAFLTRFGALRGKRNGETR